MCSTAQVIYIPGNSLLNGRCCVLRFTGYWKKFPTNIYKLCKQLLKIRSSFASFLSDPDITTPYNCSLLSSGKSWALWVALCGSQTLPLLLLHVLRRGPAQTPAFSLCRSHIPEALSYRLSLVSQTPSLFSSSQKSVGPPWVSILCSTFWAQNSTPCTLTFETASFLCPMSRFWPMLFQICCLTFGCFNWTVPWSFLIHPGQEQICPYFYYHMISIM